MPKPKIWSKIKNRILFYQDFEAGQSTTSILKTIYNYFKKGSYTLPIIDIMLPACATALNVNIRDWQNDNGFKNVLQFDVHPNSSQKTVHLYTRTLNVQGIPDPSLDPNNLCHHYDALVLKSESDDEESIGDFSSEDEYGDISCTTPSTYTSSILTFSDQIEYKTKEVPVHYVMYNARKSDHYNPFKQDMSLFNNIVMKLLGHPHSTSIGTKSTK